ncbi:ATP-binding protein [Nonomuraea basaltis]|uniref:ATP-binding protein n=1 Tax=Nonomuraea basaltis TaxID=2495887 RepID=UPI0019803F03|nr:ATP-binding protein [Nonomuraea basaltis]
MFTYEHRPPLEDLAVCAMRAERSAAARARLFTDAQLARWQLPKEVADAARLVVSELVTNAVLHSGASEVSVRLVRSASRILIEVLDDGTWRDPAADSADLPENGWGLRLVQAHAVDCAVCPTQAGTIAWALLSSGRQDDGHFPAPTTYSRARSGTQTTPKPPFPGCAPGVRNRSTPPAKKER